VPNRGIDVAVGVVPQQIPHRRAIRVLERDLALCSGRIEQEGNHCVFADVFSYVLLRVVGPHLLLVDILLENVAEHIGIDFLVVSKWAFVEMPLVLIEIVEHALESCIGDRDALAVTVRLLKLMNIE